MLERRVYVYAFDRQTGDLIGKYYLHENWISVRNIMMECALMAEKYGDKATIYIADGTRELADATRTMMQSNRFDDKVIFRTLVEQQGVRVSL